MMGAERRAPAAKHGAASPRGGWLPPPVAGALAGVLATGALLVVTAALRGMLRVRTLPEVLAEGATFYLPWWLFEYMITTFREQAKVFLLYGVLGLLAVAGAVVGLVYARWPRPRVAVGLAVGLWLLTMLVALPASGEGFFGAEFSDPLPVIASYAAGWAAFSVGLALFYRAFAGGSPGKEARA
ncbi:MAG: hypothetical protein IRZ14_08400 [Chloroflexi bacterium]|nr:hypothetical protein [Chloroflexota bacterium]